MRTAIVSDLHLGSATGEDLARDPEIRSTLLEEVASADRLVLLGDVLELRELPLAQVLASVRPFFEELGEAMAGRRVVLVPGNHDHRLAEPLLEEVALAGDALGLEHRALPAGEPASSIATWLGDAELGIAYPGVWLRDDVYATHGHYLDCHMTLPRIECLAAAVVTRAYGAIADGATPEDYERVLRPIYGLAYGLTQAGLARPEMVNRTRPSELAWRTLSGHDQARGRSRRAAIRAAVTVGLPVGVWTLNRLLHKDFDADLSATAITRSGIDAAIEMARRLDIDASHLITGHTHRAGPEENDVKWRLRDGGHLHNTGSWVYANAFHHPGAPPGPYWPGTVTWVEDEGPPRRVRLLLDRPPEQLRAAVARTGPPAARS